MGHRPDPLREDPGWRLNADARQRRASVVVAGGGRLGLPSEDGVRYRAPEVMTFDPGVPHSWDDVTEDTILAVCLVDAGP